MKRRFVIGFLFCLLLGFFCMSVKKPAFAEETDSMFVWEENKDGTVCITEIIGIETMTELTIPEMIDGKWVTGLKFNSLFHAANLRNIYLPSHIRSIYDQMFYYCVSLEDIYVSEKNENHVAINGMLFTKLPDGLCLEYVPVKKIGSYFEIPQEAVYVSLQAISNCYSLETVVLHENIKTQGHLLSTDGVDYVYEFANYFASCYNLKEIIVDKRNPDFTSEDGILYTKDKKILVAYPMAYESKEYRVPDGVEKIGWEAFYSCVGLERVTLPTSLREIGYQAFANCKNLIITNEKEHSEELLQAIRKGTAWEATLEEPMQEPQKVLLLKELAQMGEAGIFTYGVTAEEEVVITGLTETAEKDKRNRKLVIPEYLDGKPVVGISDGAFAFMPVTSVEFPEGLSEIGTGAFYGCNLVKEVHIPSTVTYLGARAFAANYLLQTISVEKENPVYTSQNGALFDKDVRVLVQIPAAYPAELYSIPDTVSVIEEYAFGNNRNILLLDIPGSVVKIREKAFWNMKELRELRIPSEIDLTSDVYAHCPKLKSVLYEKNRNEDFTKPK